MLRSSCISIIATVLAGGVPSSLAQDNGDLIKVTVTGQSALSEAEAIKDALRNAVERGGEQQIATWSEVDQAVLVKDIIKSRATGLVKSHTKLRSSRSADGVWEVEISAMVSRNLLDATWAEVEVLKDQLGQPKIMLFFDDYVNATERPESKSFAANEIERMLVNYGFRVIKKSRFEVLKGRRTDDPDVKENFETFKAAATADGADIFIEGEVTASGPKISSADDGFGTIYLWKTMGRCSGYWSATAEVLCNPPSPEVERGSTFAGKDGAWRATQVTGEGLGQAAVFELLEKLGRRATEGAVITVEIEDITDEDMVFDVQDAIGKIEKVETVHEGRYTGSVLSLNVKTKLLAPDLARAMRGVRMGPYRFKTVERTANLIRVKLVKDEP